MYLVFTKKFFDNYWKLVGWIAYISLVTISIWFTKGVLDKYAKQETAIQQDKDDIEAHPTIAICNLDQRILSSIPFSINYTYQMDGLSIDNEIALIMGENYLENLGENVNLTKIYTRYNKNV